MTEALRTTSEEAQLIADIDAGIDRFFEPHNQPPTEIRTSIANTVKAVVLAQTPEALRELLEQKLPVKNRWQISLFNARSEKSGWEADLKPSVASWIVTAELPRGYGSTLPSVCAGSVTDRLVQKRQSVKGPHV